MRWVRNKGEGEERSQEVIDEPSGGKKGCGRSRLIQVGNNQAYQQHLIDRRAMSRWFHVATSLLWWRVRRDLMDGRRSCPVYSCPHVIQPIIVSIFLASKIETWTNVFNLIIRPEIFNAVKMDWFFQRREACAQSKVFVFVRRALLSPLFLTDNRSVTRVFFVSPRLWFCHFWERRCGRESVWDSFPRDQQ